MNLLPTVKKDIHEGFLKNKVICFDPKKGITDWYLH